MINELLFIFLSQVFHSDLRNLKKTKHLGMFKPPLGGFESYPIIIEKITNPKKLPIAHTWFFSYNLLDYKILHSSRKMELPQYESKKMLREKLRYALFEAGFSFQIA